MKGSAGNCKTMRLLRYALLPLFLCAPLLSLAAGDGAREDMELRIAMRYRHHAQSALDRGNTDEARRILEAGMDWASSLSDIPALLSRLKEREGASRIEVLALQDRALRTGVFLATSQELLHDERARVLFDMGRYKEAIEVLDLLPQNHDRLALRLAAQLALQPLSENLDLCREALEQYPDSTRIAKLVLDASTRLPIEVPVQALVDRALSHLDSMAQEDPGFLWRAALFTRDFLRRRELSLRAIQEGCRESGAILGALDVGAIESSHAIALFFDGSRGPVELQDIDTLWSLMRNDEERKQFRSRLISFSGILRRPSAWGPAAPLLMYIESGKLVSTSLDRDADRHVDVEIEYFDKLPLRAVVRPAEGYSPLSALEALSANEPSMSKGALPVLVSFKWDRYPFLSSTETALLRAQYPRGSVSMDLFPHEEKPWCAGLWFLPDPSSPFLLPTEAFVRAHASQIEREGWGLPQTVERVSLAAGRPTAAIEERRGHVVLRRIFEDGVLRREELDVDEDGRFELRRYYALPDDPASDPVYGLRPVLLSVEADYEGDGRWVEVVDQ